MNDFDNEIARCGNCNKPLSASVVDCLNCGWIAATRAPLSREGIAVKTLNRHQPCGCVVCHCEDEEQCQGCGATNCGTHPAGEIPNPVYLTSTPVDQHPDRVPVPSGDKHNEALDWVTSNCTAIRRDNGDMDYSLGQMIRAFEAGKAATPVDQRTWRDISTAPRDGRAVLLWWPHWWHDPHPGYYLHNQWHSDKALSSWSVGDEDGPTAWMPLPDAPTSQPDMGNPITERPEPDVKGAALPRPEAVEALASYQQADNEGIMVLVSRQAIEECLPTLRAFVGEAE